MYQRPIVKYNYIISVYNNEDFLKFTQKNLYVIKNFDFKTLNYIDKLSHCDKLKLKCKLFNYPIKITIKEIIHAYVLFLNHNSKKFKSLKIMNDYK